MAGAIGNGPLAALGEQVEKTELLSKRKRTLVESLDAQEKEGRFKEPKTCQKEEQEVENLETSQEEQLETIPGEEQLEPTSGEELELGTSLENLKTGLEEQPENEEQKLVKEEQEVSGRNSLGVKTVTAKHSSRQVSIIFWTVSGFYIIFPAGVSRAPSVPGQAQPCPLPPDQHHGLRCDRDGVHGQEHHGGWRCYVRPADPVSAPGTVHYRVTSLLSYRVFLTKSQTLC